MHSYSELRNTKVGIIGMGYVGKNLFSKLEKLKSEYNIELYIFNRSTFDTIKGQTFDYVFNCSGNTGDFRTQIWETVNSNLSVNQFIVENTTITKALVMLSSSRIYGFTEDENHFFTEDETLLNSTKSHLDIDFIYNGTKMLMESLALNYSKNLSYKIIVCRLSNLYGNYSVNDLDDSTFLKLMLKHKNEKKTLVVNQNLFDTKDYIYIDDALDGIILSAIKSKQTSIYNICSGKSYSIKNWIKYLNIDYSLNEKKTTMHNKISIRKAKEELGFTPSNFLENLNISQIINYESNRSI